MTAGQIRHKIAELEMEIEEQHAEYSTRSRSNLTRKLRSLQALQKSLLMLERLRVDLESRARP